MSQRTEEAEVKLEFKVPSVLGVKSIGGRDQNVSEITLSMIEPQILMDAIANSPLNQGNTMQMIQDILDNDGMVNQARENSNYVTNDLIFQILADPYWDTRGATAEDVNKITDAFESVFKVALAKSNEFGAMSWGILTEDEVNEVYEKFGRFRPGFMGGNGFTNVQNRNCIDPLSRRYMGGNNGGGYYNGQQQQQYGRFGGVQQDYGNNYGRGGYSMNNGGGYRGGMQAGYGQQNFGGNNYGRRW
jgi:hypothetical protein